MYWLNGNQKFPFRLVLSCYLVDALNPNLEIWNNFSLFGNFIHSADEFRLT